MDSQRALEISERLDRSWNGEPVTRKNSAQDLLRETSIAVFGSENQRGIMVLVWKHERIMWMFAGASVMLSMTAVIIEILTYIKH